MLNIIPNLTFVVSAFSHWVLLKLVVLKSSSIFSIAFLPSSIYTGSNCFLPISSFLALFNLHKSLQDILSLLKSYLWFFSVWSPAMNVLPKLYKSKPFSTAVLRVTYRESTMSLHLCTLLPNCTAHVYKSIVLIICMPPVSTCYDPSFFLALLFSTIQLPGPRGVNCDLSS